MTTPERPRRAEFTLRYASPTRWRDNDVYGHMNNVVYAEYFDSAVNRWLIGTGALDIPRGPVIGLVAQTSVRFFAAVGFPESVEVGIGIARIGRTSVSYALALFGTDDVAAATCSYVHVYVGAATHRPTPLPPALRAALEAAPRSPGAFAKSRGVLPG